MLRNRAIELLQNSRDDNAQHAAGTDKLGNISEVQIIGAKVMVGIEAEQGIKEAMSKGQRMGLSINGKHMMP